MRRRCFPHPAALTTIQPNTNRLNHGFLYFNRSPQAETACNVLFSKAKFLRPRVNTLLRQCFVQIALPILPPKSPWSVVGRLRAISCRRWHKQLRSERSTILVKTNSSWRSRFRVPLLFCSSLAPSWRFDNSNSHQGEMHHEPIKTCI